MPGLLAIRRDQLGLPRRDASRPLCFERWPRGSVPVDNGRARSTGAAPIAFAVMSPPPDNETASSTRGQPLTCAADVRPSSTGSLTAVRIGYTFPPRDRARDAWRPAAVREAAPRVCSGLLTYPTPAREVLGDAGAACTRSLSSDYRHARLASCAWSNTRFSVSDRQIHFRGPSSAAAALSRPLLPGWPWGGRAIADGRAHLFTTRRTSRRRGSAPSARSPGVALTRTPSWS